MRKVWIEAALNGAWSLALQPGIPDTVVAIVNEGIACAPAISASVWKMHHLAHSDQPLSGRGSGADGPRQWRRARFARRDAAGAGPIGLNLPGQSRGAKFAQAGNRLRMLNVEVVPAISAMEAITMRAF